MMTVAMVVATGEAAMVAVAVVVVKPVVDVAV